MAKARYALEPIPTNPGQTPWLLWMATVFMVIAFILGMSQVQ